jgi:hypothetical protein
MTSGMAGVYTVLVLVDLVQFCRTRDKLDYVF